MSMVNMFSRWPGLEEICYCGSCNRTIWVWNCQSIISETRYPTSWIASNTSTPKNQHHAQHSVLWWLNAHRRLLTTHIRFLITSANYVHIVHLTCSPSCQTSLQGYMFLRISFTKTDHRVEFTMVHQPSGYLDPGPCICCLGCVVTNCQTESVKTPIDKYHFRNKQTVSGVSLALYSGKFWVNVMEISSTKPRGAVQCAQTPSTENTPSPQKAGEHIGRTPMHRWFRRTHSNAIFVDQW